MRRKLRVGFYYLRTCSWTIVINWKLRWLTKPLVEKQESLVWRKWVICLKKMNHSGGTCWGFADPPGGDCLEIAEIFPYSFSNMFWVLFGKPKERSLHCELIQLATASKVLRLNCDIWKLKKFNIWQSRLPEVWETESTFLSTKSIRIYVLKFTA